MLGLREALEELPGRRRRSRIDRLPAALTRSNWPCFRLRGGTSAIHFRAVFEAPVPELGPLIYRYWPAVRTLRQYEGNKSLWRVSAGAVLFVAAPVVPLAGAFASIYVGADLEAFHVALGVALATASSSAGEILRRRRDWWRLVADRLWSFERPNPATSVSVQIRESDRRAAEVALRGAHFHPAATLLTGSVPPDAPDLTSQVRVEEPEAWGASSDDADRIDRIYAVLTATGVRARVGGRDVFPAGTPDPPGSARGPAEEPAQS